MPTIHPSSVQNSDRSVFFISDGTGITAETLGHSVLAQFGVAFKVVRLPFVDTVEKVRDAVRQIDEACEKDGIRSLVFSTLVKAEFSAILQQSRGMQMDLIKTFVDPLEQELGIEPAHAIGRSHTIANSIEYENRIE